MHTLDLNGSWTLSGVRRDDIQGMPATVPGCVHTDLLAAKRIEDPFVRDNETRQFWIGETDWVYEREFEVEPALLEQECVLLECEGLDTLATLTLNGKRLGTTDNQFRSWSFDVKHRLFSGVNTISIRFKAAVPEVAKRQKIRRLVGTAGWLRKSQCNFGWDWGPTCVTAGIWRPIRVVGFSEGRIDDVHVKQAHGKGKVDLSTSVAIEAPGRQALSARMTVTLEDEPVSSETVAVKRKKAVFAQTIKSPRLWWPNGMGEQSLYEVTVELLDADGAILDFWTRRIGLRTLDVVQQADEWGTSFHFACNGIAFFAKGANWIPTDVFPSRVRADDYDYLLNSAAEAHMNMVRVWGGGIYEDDTFYDLCDELGLCVWQDFMFACAAYPSFDESFMASVKAEAEENVQRLRHHASLAIWCGNNELEQMNAHKGNPARGQLTVEEYAALFEKLLPAVVADVDPERTYWPSSPHTPGDRDNHNDPTAGDAHLWEVWHGRKPFEWYRTADHRFCSEFGFQSFPEPRTVQGYTNKEERNITSHVMELHQRSGIGNTTIMQYMLSWYRLPNGFNNTLWLSQIQQGMAIKYAVEHWRRKAPRCMGALYWQLNDCWPVASWASVDSAGRWKALQFMAKRFFAPVLVSGVEDEAKGTVEVHVSSDRLASGKGTLQWRATCVDGTPLASGEQNLRIPVNGTRKVATLRLAKLVKEHTTRDVLVWLHLVDEAGGELSRNFVSFCRPKHMALVDPGIEVKVTESKGDGFEVTLTAERPALWAWLQLKRTDAQFEDNFVCLEPGREIRIQVAPVKPMTLKAFSGQLTVSSIRDTYR